MFRLAICFCCSLRGSATSHGVLLDRLACSLAAAEYSGWVECDHLCNQCSSNLLRCSVLLANRNTQDQGCRTHTPFLAVHHEHAWRGLNNCSTTAGPIGSATYTRIDCTLSRERKIADEHLVPYPEAVDTEMLIARALSQNFQARFMMESATNRTITEIKPEELIRFYQVYMILKDTQYRQSTLRPLTVSQQVPQLSTAFLAVALLVTVLCMISSSAWCIFKLTHHSVNDVPQTKLDWLLHAIDPNEPPVDAPRSSIRCRTVGRHDQGERPPPFCRQMSDQEKFESTAYVKDLPRVRRWKRDSTSPPWANASYTSCANKHAPSIKESMLSRSSDTPSIDVVLASPAEELSESMFSKWIAR